MLITSSVTEIIALIKQGGVVAYPTEAVWGLGCDPFNEAAVQRILELKSRPVEKGLILIAGAESELTPWLSTLSVQERSQFLTRFSRPTTWIVPDTKAAPTWVRGKHNSVAIRLSEHLPVQQLCHQFQGVLVSTSANPAGAEPARDIATLQRYFGTKLDAIFDAPLGHATQPSQIRQLGSGQLVRD